MEEEREDVRPRLRQRIFSRPRKGERSADSMADDLHRQVDRELLAATYDHLNTTLAMSSAAGVGVTLMLVRSDVNWAWIWLVATLALNIVRFLHGRGRGREVIEDADEDKLHELRTKFVAGLHASSLCWGLLALAVGHSDPLAQYMLAIGFSALAAGGTGILAPLLWPGRIYIATMLLSGSFLLFDQIGHGLIMSVLGVMFLVVMLMIHRRNHQIVRQSIELKIENTGLVKDLTALNRDLEAKVQQRTRELSDAAQSDASLCSPIAAGSLSG